MSKSEDNRKLIQFRTQPDTVRRIEQWHKADGCRSRNEFIERAVNYYADALALKDNTLLPRAVKSVIDGRLGQFEEHMAYLLFKLAVETDIVATLNASAYEWSDDARKKANPPPWWPGWKRTASSTRRSSPGKTGKWRP